MYKIEFTLKQHTPLIHFQHDQAGATLRATEVKPKLDRFIIEKLTGRTGEDAFNNFKANPEWKKWLVGNGEHPALDYKINFYNPGKKSYSLPLPMSFTSRNHPDRDKVLINWVSKETRLEITLLEPTLYFANADKIKFRGDAINEYESKVNDLTFAVQAEDNVCGSIVSLNPNVLASIKANIVNFFLLNNFGTRQNKGFGSFTVIRIDNLPLENSASRLLFMYRSVRNFTSSNQTFKFIKDEYQLLKSGVNHPAYSKSKLFEYFINQPGNPIRWEKRYLKQFINLSPIGGKALFKRRLGPIDMDNSSRRDYNDFADHQLNEYKFVRALLGLSEQFEFLVEDPTTGQQDNRDKYVVSIKHRPAMGSETIDRFKSPLFFKVIDGYVYIKTDDSYRSLLNEEFEFALNLKNSRGRSIPVPSLRAPAAFDLNAFLRSKISPNWTNTF